MQIDTFFPARPVAKPTIYAFASTHQDHVGLLKVGYTEREASDRIAEQWPGGFKAYRIELIESAMRPDRACFPLILEKLLHKGDQWVDDADFDGVLLQGLQGLSTDAWKV